jgi:TIR domain
MGRNKYASIEKISSVVREALSRGATVEIDGLGSFHKTARGYRFQANGLPRVFIAYAHEDRVCAARIYDALVRAGFDPWMDERKLLPGQNWARAIPNALETSDFIICCLSEKSIHKRGGFQAELRFALECARRLPLDHLFLLPARLDPAPVPLDIARDTQYVDMFPDWESGIASLVRAIRYQMRRLRAA